MIRWFAKNDIAANLLLVAILLAGVWVAMTHVPLQVSPSYKWNTIIAAIAEKMSMQSFAPGTLLRSTRLPYSVRHASSDVRASPTLRFQNRRALAAIALATLASGTIASSPVACCNTFNLSRSLHRHRRFPA